MMAKDALARVEMSCAHQKCVGDCKKVALTIKTATGIKKIQREKGYGAWFDQLFALIKTRDSCRPEMATEPSANKDEEQTGKDDDDDDDENVEVTPKKVYVPIRSKRKVVDLVKNMVDKDPYERSCHYGERGNETE